METKVIISVDRGFSPRDHDRGYDLWLVGSEDNIQEAIQLRQTNPIDCIATFNDLGDDVTNVTSMLPTIIEHHPRATVIIVHGIKADAHTYVIRAVPASWVGRSNDDEVIVERDRRL